MLLSEKSLAAQRGQQGLHVAVVLIEQLDGLLFIILRDLDLSAKRFTGAALQILDPNSALHGAGDVGQLLLRLGVLAANDRLYVTNRKILGNDALRKERYQLFVVKAE